MAINWRERSSQEEIMDDFEMEGALLRDSLDKLATINHWLGGNGQTLKGVNELIKNTDKSEPLTIIDMGCGSGDILQDFAKFGREHDYKFTLIGIDANKDTVQYAAEQAADFPEISFRVMDVLSPEFASLKCDVFITTLFLHHFSAEQLAVLLPQIFKNSKLGVVVNDLQRSRVAYGLFAGLGKFIKNNVIVEDGLTSITRAFKKKEIQQLAKLIAAQHRISWAWAFRYLWIMKKEK